MSLQAGLLGNATIAVANVVGSNIFNVLFILGICTIARWEGFVFFGSVFFGSYVAYTLYLVLQATQHDALPLFSNVMLFFVLPLVAVTLAVVGIRALRTQRGTLSKPL